MMNHEAFESRSFRMGAILVVAGTLLAGWIFGVRHGISFLAGGLLSALNMGLLRHSINTALGRAANPKFRTVMSYIVRLLLIPLGLYVIMRLFFWGIIAAIAGFAVFGCGIFLEGVREALKGSSR
jgi:hypothetical protein